ncbi:methyltransferase [Streptomyces spiroverticillatus]|uniref:Methyltransferase n=1 Tax=Streptomyces finlayi TaxID=67296 RepID=A0A919CF76_9ACTN|nr:class I SAM-dependent methyltransferase [Streptomyces finlayi]GHA43914.1 methyltransferase [Streptomyces spiroverticillatus]GHD17507.1 methyltransferase [Streptomyces finlayi]
MQLIANTQQAEAWNGHEGKHWADNADAFDRLNSGFNDDLLRAAAIGTHDRVLDIGCGTGQITRLAAKLATSGETTGIDIAAPMVERARAATAEEGITNAHFQQGDAQVHTFPRRHYDAVVSRGGVMFFADPVTAFSNIGSALRPGGRLAFIVPQQPSPDGESTQVFAPVNTLMKQPSPAQRGMMSLSDPARAQTILAAAGFSEAHATSIEGPIVWGRNIDEAVDFYFSLGPVRFNLEGLPDTVVQQARNQVRASLLPYTYPEGIRLRGAVWLVTATSTAS